MDKENEQNNIKQNPLNAVSLALNLGYMIALPLVALSFLGRFLDKKFSTSPIFLLLAILLAIAISGALVFRKTKKMMDDINKQ